MIPKAFFTFFLLVYRMMANLVSYFIFDMTKLIMVPEKASLNPRGALCVSVFFFSVTY